MRCLRHIPLPNVHNFRDLGGYPAADGKMTRWGLLFRTDALSELTEEGWEGLRELGVMNIIDLRSAKEREQMPVEPLYPLSYMGYSLMGDSEYGPAPTPVLEDEDDDSGDIADETHDGVMEGKDNGPAPGSEDKDPAPDIDARDEFMRSTRLDYTATLFTNIPCAVDILDAILSVLDEGKGSTAYMCTAGKDRTGIVSALILYLAGVPDEDIIADYMVSNVYNTNGVNKKMIDMIKNILKKEPDPAFLKENMGSDPETMRRLLASFRKRDLKGTLSKNGFGEDKQARLAQLITE